MARQPTEQSFNPVFDDFLDFTTADFQDFDVDFPLPGDVDVSQPLPGDQAVYPTPYYDGLQTLVNAPTPSGALPQLQPAGIPLAAQPQQPQPTLSSPTQFANIVAAPPQDKSGQKRKSAGPSAVELEQQTRAAAEEDKRRRNTAASARFRVKKKQREQALETTVKEMTEKVHILEAKVGQLETENKWLRGLVTEKDISLDGGPPQYVAEATEEEEGADEEPETKKQKTATEETQVSV